MDFLAYKIGTILCYKNAVEGRLFDKKAIVKFKISNNYKQNIDEKHSKQTKIHRKIYISHEF